MSPTIEPTPTIKLFYSFAHKDLALLEKLDTHLSILKQQGFISVWDKSNINAGENLQRATLIQLDNARIILLLMSPDFLASDFCQGIEIKRALERHKTGEIRILPIILRPCDWKETFTEKLQVLPTTGKAITLWKNRDVAWLQVAQGIRSVVEEINTSSSSCLPTSGSDFRNTAQDNTASNAQKTHINNLVQQEQFRQEKHIFHHQQPVKIDKNIIVSYDLDTQMQEFNKRLNFGTAHGFVIGGQNNILRDYIIERMCKEFHNKLGRTYRKIDISLLIKDFTEDEQQVIRKKIITKQKCKELLELFKENEDTDIVLTIWNHYFPPEKVKTVAHFFWNEVTSTISPFLDSTGQCFIIILANVGEKVIIQQLDQFFQLPMPEQFEVPRLKKWVAGWLKTQGVDPTDIETSIHRLEENQGHFLATYQEIESIISDLKGKDKGI